MKKRLQCGAGYDTIRDITKKQNAALIKRAAAEEKMSKLGVMLDCSRNGVYSVAALKKYVSVLAKMGYNSLQLYTEEVYEIPEEPYFGYLRGRYTEAELRELDAYAAERGVELVPCIQTLAHLGGLTRWPEYAPCTDISDILLAGCERTYALIENMFRTLSRCFTSRRVNIGMDEAHSIGLGKYLDEHGYCNRFDILKEHLRRVGEIAAKYGFKPMMWSDMFFRLANHGKYDYRGAEMPKEITSLVPENVDLVYWDYYADNKEFYDGMLKAHKKFGRHVVFAGGAWSWMGFAPHNSLTLRNSKFAMQACLENGVDDIFITTWKDDGAESSLFCNLPTLYACAEYSRGNFDDEDIRKKFDAEFDISFDDFMKSDLADACLGKEEFSNPCKYMLYSDPFLGFLDSTVKDGAGKIFAETAETLAKNVHGEYGYLFRALSDLCCVLEYKSELGVKTRKAYAKGRKEVQKLLPVYDEVLVRLEKFYDSFSAQWDEECKQNGFENHDIRLGGLIRRVTHCRKMLAEFAEGKRESIPALEEKILPFPSADAPLGKAVCFNGWHQNAMIKPFM